MHPRKRTTNSKTKSPGKNRDESSTEEEVSRNHGLSVFKVLVVLSAAYTLWYFIDWKNLLTPTVKSFARVGDIVPSKFSEVPCSSDYDKEISKFPECVPRTCGRVVKDNVISSTEALALLEIGKRGLQLGGSTGGASILDLHSGALSKEDKFIDIYRLMKQSDTNVFSEEDLKLYSQVKNKIHDAIAEQFGIPKDKLFLTYPTFFSQMTTRPAKTVHDEYWHPHIDKEQYGTFHYTSLLYLASYGTDFDGGRFIFVDKDTNTTVEPKLGRVSFFTSGSENVHHVERVTRGTCYAITVSFTCDPKHAIGDPRLR